MKSAITNIKFNLLESWLANVAYSHSGSAATESRYRRAFQRFCDFTGLTPKQIPTDYEASTDRLFRRKYAQYIRAWIATLSNKGYARNTITSYVAAVSSFFKYNDLPLGHISMARNSVIYHNRDITREEIADILSISNPRNRAFFSVMVQSGLRPHAICLLQLKHLQPDFSKGVIPCCVKVPKEIAKGKIRSNFTFIGEEAVKYLKDYLKTRPNLNPESYLFTQHGKEKRINPRDASHRFRDAALRLKEKGLLDFEQKEKGKPSEIRLYSLRKFFRKHAGQAGVDYVNFWMEHTANYKAPHIPASDEHYFSTEDIEFQRKIYAEKAMPFLRLETPTPSETEQTIMELTKKLEERNGVIKKLEERVKDVEKKYAKVEELDRIITRQEATIKEDEQFDKTFQRFLATKYPKLLEGYKKILNVADEHYYAEVDKIEKRLTKKKKE